MSRELSISWILCNVDFELELVKESELINESELVIKTKLVHL